MRLSDMSTVAARILGLVLTIVIVTQNSFASLVPPPASCLSQAIPLFQQAAFVEPILNTIEPYHSIPSSAERRAAKFSYLQSHSVWPFFSAAIAVLSASYFFSPKTMWYGLSALIIGGVYQFSARDGSYPFEKVTNIPAFFKEGFGNYHLELRDVKALRLRGAMDPAAIFENPDVDLALKGSIAQALGSILFAGGGKGIKEVADGNAVFMGEQQLRDYTRRQPTVAVLILGDEGSRDESYSLDVMSIYYQGEKKNYESLSDLHPALNDLYKKGVRVIGFVGDALEVTNGLTIADAGEKLQEPTNSWSMFSLFDGIESEEYLPFVSDDSRMVGISYEAPTDAGVLPLDTPSVAVFKIARAHARQAGRLAKILPGSAAYAKFEKNFVENFMSNVDIAMLGHRSAGMEKATDTKRHRNQDYIDDANRLSELYPGLRVITPGDGDCVLRVLSALGIPGDGRHRITFARTGSAESMIAALAADLNPTGHFPRRFVSSTATNAALNLTTADPANFTKGEIEEQFERLGIPPHVYNNIIGTTPRTGIIALTAVTGANENVFGRILPELLKRVTFRRPKDNLEIGTVRLNTILVTRDGSAFVVRSTFASPNLDLTRTLIELASPAAQDYRLKATPKRIALLGMPGAGKGTHGAQLSKELKVPFVGMSDLLRLYLTPEEKEAMRNGGLVDDNRVFEILAEELTKQKYDKGYILDGFPRTIEQWKRISADKRFGIDLVAYFDIEETTYRNRANKRHADAIALNQTARQDDEPAIVENRIRTYQDQTAPLVEYLRTQEPDHFVELNSETPRDIAFTSVSESIRHVYNSIIQPGVLNWLRNMVMHLHVKPFFEASNGKMSFPTMLPSLPFLSRAA